MKSRIIKTACALGGYRLARHLTADQPKLLMYHRFSKNSNGHAVSEKVFEQQLQVIKKFFNPMTLVELAAIKQSGNPLPKHAVVITVDDGYQDFYDIAFPLLKHYKIPATFFVTTGFINQDLWLWPDQVTWLLRNKQATNARVQVAGRTIDLDRAHSEVWKEIIDTFLTIPNEARLSGLVALAQACGVSLPQEVPEKYAASSWHQLKEMQDNGIEIGGHTVSHPSLGHMSELEVAWELNTCMNMLSEHLGQRPRTFCYPNGQPADYSEAVKRITKEAGFTAAVTAFSDRHNLDLPYAWRRFVGCEEAFQFNKSLFGVEHLGNRARNTARCGY